VSFIPYDERSGEKPFPKHPSTEPLEDALYEASLNGTFGFWKGLSCRAAKTDSEPPRGAAWKPGLRSGANQG